MTREQYIEAVKVKLEEISPFDEPASFIADDDDSANTVKPIKSYIEQSLDEAAHNCLLTLPLAFLHADMVRQQPAMQIDGNGVGIISPFSSKNRLVRFRHPALLRDITSYITTEDPIYLLQQKKCTRGGIAKPVMVLASNAGGEDVTATTVGQLEIYSFPQDLNGTTDATGVLLYIPTDKHVDTVNSPIEELIVLECAAMVASILGDANTIQVCQQQQLAKIQSI